MKILLVADNEQIGQLLHSRLEKRGHQVILATDEDSAFSSAKAAHPHIVILEEQLRGGEDWAVAKRLKYDDHTREIPIIGLAGAFSDEARDAAVQNGCVDILGKPVDFAKLLQMIEQNARAAETDEEPI